MDKATKRISLALLDFWESQYYYPGAEERTKRYAKRDRKRAQRRLDKELIKEQQEGGF